MWYIDIEIVDKNERDKKTQRNFNTTQQIKLKMVIVKMSIERCAFERWGEQK